MSPWLLESFNERPYGYVLPLVAIAGLVGMLYFDFRDTIGPPSSPRAPTSSGC